MSPSTYGTYSPIGNVMTTFLTNPQWQRHSGPRRQQADYNEGRMEGRGGSQVVAGRAIEVLSRNTKVGLVCWELKEGCALKKTWLFRWLIVTLEQFKWKNIVIAHKNGSLQSFHKCWCICEQKHLRPKLDYAHVPRELSRAWLILHQWESHHSNQVPAAWEDGESREKNKVLTCTSYLLIWTGSSFQMQHIRSIIHNCCTFVLQ